MELTAIATADPSEFNIRECPIWAIPQISHILRNVYNSKGIHFRVSEPGIGFPHSSGVFFIHIQYEGTYMIHLLKRNMERYDRLNKMGYTEIPAMYWVQD